MIGRRIFGAIATAAVLAASAWAQTSPAAPQAVMIYAGAPGRLTQDRDAEGGNPFASALIEVLKVGPSTLADFIARLAAANARHSGGWQQLQFPKRLPDWRLDAPAPGKHQALVLINADYSKSSAGVYSLPGAAFDAVRIPAALRAAGFETRLVLDANADAARKAMAEFSRLTESAEASLIYVGGHGVQHKRVVYWIAGDYPEQNANWLPTHAIALDEIGAAGRAHGVNLVFYASCRDDPFSR